MRRDLVFTDVSDNLEAGFASSTHSSSGVAAPQLLAMKRFVEDDLAAAATMLTSACPAAESTIMMVEITV